MRVQASAETSKRNLSLSEEERAAGGVRETLGNQTDLQEMSTERWFFCLLVLAAFTTLNSVFG